MNAGYGADNPFAKEIDAAILSSDTIILCGAGAKPFLLLERDLQPKRISAVFA
jgi:hypothetical protein